MPAASSHRRLVALAGLIIGLAGCGGGGGGRDAPAPAPAPAPPSASGDGASYADPLAYSSAPEAALTAAVEAAAVTRHQLTLGAGPIAYTARAGHLIARDLASGAARASMFSVAYTVDGAPAASRPVTFFYNGGPGSASVWLHLGSFGPKRLVTGVPATTAATPFALVDNAESLLDVSDLVFVNAVGSGLSQAIAPNTNQTFWGVDADAEVFRDFIVRWLAVNGRSASPRYLYGESYGGPRTAVLTRLLQDAGVAVDGIVLQSPAMDYHSNCGVTGAGFCSAHLPTYAAIGAWHGLASPAPGPIDGHMAAMREFTATRYAPALASQAPGAVPPAELPPLLAAHTGIAAALWTQQFNLAPGGFQSSLLPGAITGRYDGRMSAARGSALAADGDPSSTFIAASFAHTIPRYLRDSLGYSSVSTYVLLSRAIESWSFRHAGRDLPDTVPDLAAALAQNPALQVLAMSGYHDLATPFYLTELDLARLASPSRVQVRNYPGGHMTYLDDATRARQKADLAAFYRGSLASAAAGRKGPLAIPLRPSADRVGRMPLLPEAAWPEPALQAPLRDPWVPRAAAHPAPGRE